MSKFAIGDRVLILQTHPHAGKLGTVVALDTLALIAHLGPRPKVRLDSGEECYITRDSHAQLVTRLRARPFA